jgi:hypothetical protein
MNSLEMISLTIQRMELASGSFWDNFYSEPREEWYFSMHTMLDLLTDLLATIPSPIVLHGGCGNSFLGESFLNGKIQLIEFDISPLAFSKINRDHARQNLILASILTIPIRCGCVDVVIEKGLFDSLTSVTTSATTNSYQMLSEYDRILTSKGFVIIFSIFGPSSNKDTLGLLNHPNFTVECKDIFISPAEIPSQDFCFMYVLCKV